LGSGEEGEGEDVVSFIVIEVGVNDCVYTWAKEYAEVRRRL